MGFVLNVPNDGKDALLLSETEYRQIERVMTCRTIHNQ